MVILSEVKTQLLTDPLWVNDIEEQDLDDGTSHRLCVQRIVQIHQGLEADDLQCVDHAKSLSKSKGRENVQYVRGAYSKVNCVFGELSGCLNAFRGSVVQQLSWYFPKLDDRAVCNYLKSLLEVACSEQVFV